MEEKDGPNVIQPNYMGDGLENRGADVFFKNYGHGVAEALPDEEEDEPVSEQKNKLRVSKAREFGKTKDKVGF